jgi:hypothetical protein
MSMMQFSEAKKLKPLPEEQASEYNTLWCDRNKTRPKCFNAFGEVIGPDKLLVWLLDRNTFLVWHLV